MAPPETSIQTSNVPQNTTMENTPPENISPERVTPQKMLETRPEISSDGRSQPVEPGSLATGHNGKKSGKALLLAQQQQKLLEEIPKQLLRLA